MKKFFSYIAAIVVLIGAVVLIYVFSTGKGDNTIYGIILGSMGGSIIIQALWDYYFAD